uniref:Putative secreted peptide n=1 Tax=Anopheles braziliensis TaxID=58242 RepID=A0A2M3ZRK3_9DIPT
MHFFSFPVGLLCIFLLTIRNQLLPIGTLVHRWIMIPRLTDNSSLFVMQNFVNSSKKIANSPIQLISELLGSCECVTMRAP